MLSWTTCAVSLYKWCLLVASDFISLRKPTKADTRGRSIPLQTIISLGAFLGRTWSGPHNFSQSSIYKLGHHSPSWSICVSSGKVKGS